MRIQAFSRWYLALAVWLIMAGGAGAAPAAGSVLVIDLKGTVDPAMATLLENVLVTAAENGSRGVIMVIDTPGGLVDQAVRMKQALLRSSVPTVAFVKTHATSAGALITLAANQIYMAPGTTIGAAEPIPFNDKNVAFVRGEFIGAAKARGRNETVAAAMVDKTVSIPAAIGLGPLNLTAEQAEDLGMIDGLAADVAAVAALAGFGDSTLGKYTLSIQQQLGRFLTRPIVAGLLLLAGITGLAVEFTKPGLGLPGLIGIVGFIGFLGGHYLVGSARILDVALVILGVALLAVEMFIPGFGVFGVAGIGALGAGIYLSAPSPQLAMGYTAVAAIGLVIVVIFLFRYISQHGMVSWLRLDSKLDAAGGYVPAVTDLKSLVGAEGVSLTPLRPAGTAQIGERKVDVVSEGQFVPADHRLRVVLVDGTRVLVRPISDAPKQEE